MNSSKRPQPYSVTIYEDTSSDREVINPGSLEGIVEQSGRRHNANNEGKVRPFNRASRYEVVVEVDSRKLLPKVVMWNSYTDSSVIHETVIFPSKFKN